MPVEMTPAAGAPAPRPVARSVARGLRCRCPNCGQGRLFAGYLQPVMTCAACGEDLSHQRSDDAAPYFTIVAVGHAVVPLLLTLMQMTAVGTATLLAIALPTTALLAFALLRPIKGGVIGLQWALRMHGFGGAEPDAPEAWPLAPQPLGPTGLAKR
jgi:uncharacterized protein (DUF983 family)